MIITNNHDIYNELLKMRNLDFDNSRRFIHENMYWNYRIGGLQAALGYSQIGSYKESNKTKTKTGETICSIVRIIFKFVSTSFSKI